MLASEKFSELSSLLKIGVYSSPRKADSSRVYIGMDDLNIEATHNNHHYHIMLPRAKFWINTVDTNSFIIKLSTPHLTRSVTTTIRQVCRSRPSPSHLMIQRAASTKHPRSFVPPTDDDLVDLRDRVQEFTRES